MKFTVNMLLTCILYCAPGPAAIGTVYKYSRQCHISLISRTIFPGTCRTFKVTRPSFFGGVPSYFEALWYPHLYFYRKSNT